MSMEIAGEYRIPAAQQRVWEALNDPAVLKACIAGCQQLDRIGDNEFSAIVATKVGPISATFRGSVNLCELEPPNGYTLIGQGQGGAAGFARMKARVGLKPGASDTVLSYSAQAEIGGKLASVGSRLVQSVARKNADDFFSAFARQLGGTGVVEQAPAPSATAPDAPRAQAAPQFAGAGTWGAPVPAWLVVFGSGLRLALGYCLALVTH
jgi:carbon monoxide dehydrogenase subunit G